MKKTIILLSVCVIFVTCDFNRSKKLNGTNYMLMDDVNGFIGLYYMLDSSLDGGMGVSVLPGPSGYVRSVYWDDKYILAYRETEGKASIDYYIIEQLKTDTIFGTAPWTTYNRVPWVIYKCTDNADFHNKIHTLEIDTMDMHHYHWKR